MLVMHHHNILHSALGGKNLTRIVVPHYATVFGPSYAKKAGSRVEPWAAGSNAFPPPGMRPTDCDGLVGSEAGGFVQVLSVDAAGDVRTGTSSSTALTPVGCDTQDWRLSPGGGEELYTSHNCDHWMVRVRADGQLKLVVRTGDMDGTTDSPLKIIVME